MTPMTPFTPPQPYQLQPFAHSLPTLTDGLTASKADNRVNIEELTLDRLNLMSSEPSPLAGAGTVNGPSAFNGTSGPQLAFGA
jgi:hypothetical protein